MIRNNLASKQCAEKMHMGRGTAKIQMATKVVTTETGYRYMKILLGLSVLSCFSEIF